jgi:hypothetical protein
LRCRAALIRATARLLRRIRPHVLLSACKPKAAHSRAFASHWSERFFRPAAIRFQMKIRSPVCSKQSTRRLPTPRVAKSKRLLLLQDDVQNLFFKSFSNQSMTMAVCCSVCCSVGDCRLSEACLESSPYTRCIASC